MRILVDARPIMDPAQGGVSRVAHALVSAYAETFPQDEILCVTTGSQRPQLPPDLAERANVIHEHITVPNKLWSAMCFFSVASLVGTIQKRTGKIDAAFFPNLGFVGTLPTDVPTTLLLHDLSFLIEPKWFSWKQRLWHRIVRAQQLIRSATHLLSVSETTKQDANRLFAIPVERIRVIPVGPTLYPSNLPFVRGGHLNSLPLAKGELRGSRYLLAMGSADPRKNIQMIVEAVSVMRQDADFTDVKLIVAGGNNRPSDEELLNLYAHASAFLYPSWYEGYGLPLHEAAMFGTPCVASTAGALPETAPMGTLFANPAKPHEWIQAIQRVLGDQKGYRTTALKTSPTAWKEAARIMKSLF